MPRSQDPPAYDVTIPCPESGYPCYAFYIPDDPNDPHGPGRLEYEASREFKESHPDDYAKAVEWCDKHTPEYFGSVYEAEEYLRDITGDEDIELWNDFDYPYPAEEN